MIQGGYCREKLDASHSYGFKGTLKQLKLFLSVEVRYSIQKSTCQHLEVKFHRKKIFQKYYVNKGFLTINQVLN